MFAATGDFRPTDQVIAVRDVVVEKIDKQLDRLEKLIDNDVQALNQAIIDSQIPAIFVQR